MGPLDGVGLGFDGFQVGSIRDVRDGMVLGATVMGASGFGFSLAPAMSSLIAGIGWTSGSSSYYGRYPGVSGIATISNDYQRGWTPGYGLGVGLGLGIPMLGGLKYFMNPVFIPMAMFAWMYNQTFGAESRPQAQPAGPAQAAAPQSAAATAPAEDKKAEGRAAEESGDAAKKGGKASRQKGGRKKRGVSAPTAKIAEEFQSLYTKYKAAGGDMKKLDPKDARRLAQLAKKYPSLISSEKGGDATKKEGGAGIAGAKEDANSGEKAEKVAAARADYEKDVQRKKARLKELEEKSRKMTLSAGEQEELDALQKYRNSNIDMWN